MMAYCKCTVHGRVQGVGFRYWTRKTAQALRLTGWVRNLSDGSGELVLQGDAPDLKELQERLWQGPAFSKVTAVHCTPYPTDENFDDFTIRR